jgi:hypothetical protein
MPGLSLCKFSLEALAREGTVDIPLSQDVTCKSKCDLWVEIDLTVKIWLAKSKLAASFNKREQRRFDSMR